MSPKYKNLFDRLLQGKLSPEEADELIALLGTDPPDPQAAALLEQHFRKSFSQVVSPETTASLEARLPAILSQKSLKPAVRTPLYKKARFYYSSAAAVILCIIGTWFWMNRREPSLATPFPQARTNKPVAGSGKNIVLTLDNGQTLALDSTPNGFIVRQNGATAMLGNGNLTYNGEGSAANAGYNTLTIPKGKQFQVLLPDGTRVWLNAASSMRYPTVFTGGERRVEITGEAYFEVAKDPSLPFRVKVQDKPAEIEVLGTHFNINAYSNEAGINTTLLEGSVKVSAGVNQVVIKPGQQARVTSGIKVVKKANLQKVMAWKEGVFNFQDESLQDVMRQLERWYDIEVVYEKGIPPVEFVGKMGRDLSLPDVLRGLEASEVHFSMQGRKLIVKP
ncbi:MAG: FecR domain-containing protein [Williamsia sp.]|nr:FecR domain-containing protein [Williamsia sp.]